MSNIGFVNTWGPGGQRRGPIWVSGGRSKKVEELNGQIFCDVIRRTNSYDQYMFANLFPTYSGHGYIPNIFPPQNNDPSNFSLQYTPFLKPGDSYTILNNPNLQSYITDIGVSADELSYYIDIDMVFAVPTIKRAYVGDLNHGDTKCNQDLTTTGYDAGTCNQINQDGKALNNSFYYKTQGQIYPTNPNNSINDILAYDRLAVPPCCYRLKGRVWFSDFPFVRATLPSNLSFPSTQATSWFLSEMNNYTAPADSLFNGAGVTKNNPDNPFYTKFKMKNLPAVDGEYINEYSTGSSGVSESSPYYQYTYTKGFVYEDDESVMQLLFLPIVYPAVATTFGVSGSYNLQSDGDYVCRVTSNQDYQARFNTNLFFKHAIPGFIQPIVRLPYVDTMAFDSEAQIAEPTRQYPHPYTISPQQSTTITDPLALKNFYGFTPNYVTESYLLQTTNKQRFAGYDSSNVGSSYITRSTLGVRNRAFDLSSAGANRQPANFISPVFNDPFGVISGIDSYPHGYLQPTVIKDEKYIQDIDCAVAQCLATKVSTHSIPGESTGWSGRYKFCGFKGKLSYFETHT